MIRFKDGQEIIKCDMCSQEIEQYAFPYYNCWEHSDIKDNKVPENIMCESCMAAIVTQIQWENGDD